MTIDDYVRFFRKHLPHWDIRVQVRNPVTGKSIYACRHLMGSLPEKNVLLIHEHPYRTD